MALRDLVRRDSERSLERREHEHPLVGFQREMRDLLERFLPGFEIGGLDGGFHPRLDVAENEKEVCVSAELPGIDEKDVEVSVGGGMLTVRGQRREEKTADEKGWVRREQSYGAFRRSIALPCDVDVEKADATFGKGILRITLPKAASAQGKRIEVKAA